MIILWALKSWSQAYHPIPEGCRSMFFYNTIMDNAANGSNTEVWQEIYRDSTYFSGNDTIIRLNYQVGTMAETEICSTMNNIGYSYLYRSLYQPGNFGSHCIVRPSMGYAMVNPYGDTLWLNTNGNIGSYWNARPHLPGYDTARIVALGDIQLPGFPLDSFIEISYFSNRIVRISKNHGIIYFDGFLDANCPSWSTAQNIPKYTLIKPIELKGQKIYGLQLGIRTAYPADAFWFKPGDVIGYNHHREYGFPFPQINNYYDYYWILDSAQIDSSHYRYTVRHVTGIPTMPTAPDTIQIGFSRLMPGAGMHHGIITEGDLSDGIDNNQGVIYSQLVKNGLPELYAIFTIQIDTCNGQVFALNNSFELVHTLKLVSEAGVIERIYRYGFPITEYSYYLYCLYKPNHPYSTSNCGFKVDIEQNVIDISTFQIYPNPTTKEFWISILDGMKLEQDIHIFDSQGKLIAQIPGPDTSKIAINTDGFPEGIIRVVTKVNGSLVSKSVWIKGQ